MDKKLLLMGKPTQVVEHKHELARQVFEEAKGLLPEAGPVENGLIVVEPSH